MKHRFSRWRSKIFQPVFFVMAVIVVVGFVELLSPRASVGTTKRKMPEGQLKADVQTLLAMLVYVFTDDPAADPASTNQPTIVAVNASVPDHQTCWPSNQSVLNISASTNLPARS